MQRLIVTGANGAGKSHVAARLSALRPDVPLVSFDAIKLLEGWQQRPRVEIEQDLEAAVAGPAWIIEGGPSLLPVALPRAEAVLWLDPPGAVRAGRLLLRPWRNLGRTRPELPKGNRDWPIHQYRFALRSLRKGAVFRQSIAAAVAGAGHVAVWRCRTAADTRAALDAWARDNDL
ncbi:MAG: DNA topology modulation protein FlaR [Rhodobacteraceae bacterium]|nr:DNA topology modulation protein FlaR [Paracoccaceae bacterium]